MAILGAPLVGVFLVVEGIQARNHTQHATTYNSDKLEQAPVMVE